MRGRTALNPISKPRRSRERARERVQLGEQGADGRLQTVDAARLAGRGKPCDDACQLRKLNAPSTHGGSRVFRSRREQPWAPLERSNPGRRPRQMTTASGSVVQRPHGSAPYPRHALPLALPVPRTRPSSFAGDGALESWACLGAHPSFLRRGAHSTGYYTALHVYERGERGGPWLKERILGRGGADGRPCVKK